MAGAVLDEVGPWSREKLELLGKYLAAYTNILSSGQGKKYCSSFHYIDAFAGSVEHIDKEQQTIIDGSPRIALKTNPRFHSYTFIEKSSSRVEERVLPLLEEFPEHKIRVLKGDCNVRLVEHVLPEFPRRQPNRANKLGFIFLDPYGINLKWETVKAFGDTNVFDVLINFSVMGIIRQCSETPPENSVCQSIDTLMGSHDWFHAVYQKSRQLTLFDMGPKLDRCGDQLAERLTKLYCTQLETCFKHVSRPVIMRNRHGCPLYALILASQAKLAVDKMHEIFRSTERSRKQR